MNFSEPLSPTARANRRRRRVFGAVVVLALAASWAYVFQRPAQYQASARWLFAFADRDDAAVGAAAPEANPVS